MNRPMGNRWRHWRTKKPCLSDLMIDAKYDLSSPEVKREFIRQIGALGKGIYSVCIKKYVSKRSNPQLGYFHAVIVKSLADHLRNEGIIEGITDEEAKGILKDKFLRLSQVVNYETGECIEYTLSLATLDREAMSVFIDQCIRWLEEFFGIIVPPPDPFYERKKKEKNVENKTDREASR